MSADMAAVLYPSATAPAPAAPTAAPAVAMAPAAAAPAPAAAPAAAQEAASPAEPTSAVADVPEIAMPKSFADVRWTGEPPASSTTDYASFALHADSPGPINIADPVMHDQALQAMQAAGIGQTLGRFMYGLAKDHYTNPPNTDRATTETQLKAAWGTSYDANLAAARGLVAKAESAWPGVRKYLADSGLGNSPAFLIAAARKATGK